MECLKVQTKWKNKNLEIAQIFIDRKMDKWVNVHITIKRIAVIFKSTDKN
jgi:hypothetical protein